MAEKPLIFRGFISTKNCFISSRLAKKYLKAQAYKFFYVYLNGEKNF